MYVTIRYVLQSPFFSFALSLSISLSLSLSLSVSVPWCDSGVLCNKLGTIEYRDCAVQVYAFAATYDFEWLRWVVCRCSANVSVSVTVIVGGA